MEIQSFLTALLVAQACFDFVLGFVLLRFYRSYRDSYLLHWSLSWYALAVYHAVAIGAMFVAQEQSPGDPARFAGSMATFIAGYFQILWLVAGTYELVRKKSLSNRTVWWSLAALSATSVVFVAATSQLGTVEMRLFTRVALRSLAAGLAFLGASYGLIGATSRRRTSFGSRLAGFTLAAYGLSQLVYFLSYTALVTGAIPADYLFGTTFLIYMSVGDVLLQALMGVGLVIWLLEEQQQKLLETEGRLHQSQQLASLGRLAGGIAHDFNNLLTVILGYSDLLETSEDRPASVRRTAHEIKVAAERAAGLTSQLVAFSRKQVLEPKVIDLNEMVSDLDRMLRRLIGEDIDVITAFHSELAPVLVDQGQIEQVVVNLVLNARDAMPHGGTLTIETRAIRAGDTLTSPELQLDRTDYILLVVRDTGVGMAPNTLEQAFEPFFTTKERTKGTGLGLSTVYGIVHQSGGTIRAQSEPGQGTAVEVYLPRAEGAPTIEPMEVERAPGGAESILVAEDEDSVREMVAEALRGRGYDVIVADNGEDALTTARTRARIDLLVTDLIMPRMSGAELARQLQNEHPDLPVLYMSGYLDDDLLHRDLKPSQNLLAKPFTPSQLERRVHEILRNRSPAPAAK